MLKNKFVVIEGIDGSGKNTQAKLLVNNFKQSGQKSVLISFPRYNKESSALIREYLAGKFGDIDDVGPYRASVMYAIDRYAESFKIREYLSRGYWVVADRYTSSNKGHQASKIKSKKDRLKFLVWLNEFEYEIMGIPIPDKTIYLDLPARIAYKNVLDRSKKTGRKIDLHDETSHLRKSRDAYLEIAKIDPYEKWVVVNCANESEMLNKVKIQDMILENIK